MILPRYKCECGWIGTKEELLEAVNPCDVRFTLYGCPGCKDFGLFTELCDELGCNKESTCGVPTPDGYRRVCGEHYRTLAPALKGE